jgi:hypothetical protein
LSLVHEALNPPVPGRYPERLGDARTSMTFQNRCQEGEVFGQTGVFESRLVEGIGVVVRGQARSVSLGNL